MGKLSDGRKDKDRILILTFFLRPAHLSAGSDSHSGFSFYDFGNALRHDLLLAILQMLRVEPDRGLRRLRQYRYRFLFLLEFFGNLGYRTAQQLLIEPQPGAGNHQGTGPVSGVGNIDLETPQSS